MQCAKFVDLTQLVISCESDMSDSQDKKREVYCLPYL